MSALLKSPPWKLSRLAMRVARFRLGKYTQALSPMRRISWPFTAAGPVKYTRNLSVSRLSMRISYERVVPSSRVAVMVLSDSKDSGPMSESYLLMISSAVGSLASAATERVRAKNSIVRFVMG